MPGSTFGEIFKLTTFGESHGPAIGGIVEGCPAGLKIDLQRITKELNRRRPGQSSVTSPRKEQDEFEILSGMFENTSTGAPIAFLIRSHDYKPADYDAVKDAYRPSHADFTFSEKYGLRDYRGGGRSSARETAARVFGGAIASQLLRLSDVKIHAFVSEVGDIAMDVDYDKVDFASIENSIVRCPDEKVSQKIIRYIEQIKSEGDTTGGVISCVVSNVPVGLGEPVFDKLHADLGKAMLSINASHGFEYGSGFAGAKMKGSQHNDSFSKNKNGKMETLTNNSGGIQGGISNGMNIYFRVAFKPVSTIQKKQETVNSQGEKVQLDMKGRHDPCVVPRAVPIVEAMTALVLADHLLRNRTSRI